MKKLILILVLLFVSNCVLASELVILHTSDVHGRISPIEYNNIKNSGGFSKRVEFVNSVRNTNKNVLLLDSGDYFQGSLYYRIYKGKISAKLLPYIKYDAIALGNHEFDDGLKVLKRNIRKSKTQFISCNVHFQDRYLKNAVKPYILKEFDGEKYLIIGATTPDLKNLSSTNEVKITNPVDEIKYIIKTVPHDKVILVSHCGLDVDKDIAKNIPQIDLILGGHNHYFFPTPKYIGKTPIIQDGEFGIRVGKIEFDKKLKHYTYQYITPDMKSSEKIDKVIHRIDKKLDTKRNKVLAKTKITLIGEQNTIEHCQTNLGRLVLMSMIQDFPEYDVVMTNSGSIRINRNIKDKVTFADVLELLPFENSVVEVEIQGKYLKNILKHGQQTNRRYLQYHVKDGCTIDDNKCYKVVTNSYVASGKDGYENFKYGKIIKVSKKTHVKLFCKLLEKMNLITNENIKF